MNMAASDVFCSENERKRMSEWELVCDICGVLRWVKLLVFFSCSFVLSSLCFSKLFNALGCALCLALSHISFLFSFFPPLGFFVTLFLNFIWFQEHFTGCAPSFHQLKLNRNRVTASNAEKQTKANKNWFTVYKYRHNTDLCLYPNIQIHSDRNTTTPFQTSYLGSSLRHHLCVHYIKKKTAILWNVFTK